MTKRMLGFGVSALIVLTLVALPARGSSLPQQSLDFLGGGSAASSLSFTTAVGNSLSIMNALITQLEAIPANKFLPVTHGALSFSTMGCVKGCFANKIPGGYMSSPVFMYGGSLTLVGQLAGMSSPETLLMGTFSPFGLNSGGKQGADAPNATLNSKTGKGGFNASLAINVINPAIYADFAPLIFKSPGSDGKSYVSEMSINLSFIGLPAGIHTATGTWSGAVGSTGLLVKPAPEPPGLLLLGSALLAVAAFLRRKPKLV